MLQAWFIDEIIYVEFNLCLLVQIFFRVRTNFVFVFGRRTHRFSSLGLFSFSTETSIGSFLSVSSSAETKVPFSAQSETARSLHLPSAAFISGIQYSFIWIQLLNCKFSLLKCVYTLFL